MLYYSVALQIPPFTEAYIQRLKDGDAETERHFSAYFGRLILVKLRGSVRSAQDLFDVRQETFLRVLRLLRDDKLEHPERLGAFVAGVCERVVHEYLRAKARFNIQATEAPEPIDERIGLERELILGERKRLVETILGELPPKDGEILRLVFYQEADKAEICRRLKVTPDYLRVVLHRAKSRFREKYRAKTSGHETESGPASLNQ